MSRLTERERAVWDKRNAGFTFKQIAEDLGLCVQTVSFAFRKAERKVEYEKATYTKDQVGHLVAEVFAELVVELKDPSLLIAGKIAMSILHKKLK